MSNEFSIIAKSSVLSLDRNRQGAAVFTVENKSGRELAGRALIATDPTDAGHRQWLSLEGETEQQFTLAEVVEYTVAVTAPDDAEAKSYIFRLNMQAEDDPDEGFTEGPTVTIPIATPLPKPKPRWWLFAIIAAVVLVLLAVIAYWLLRPKPDNVPDIVELTQASAEALLADRELAVGDVSSEPSDTMADDLVLRTDPSAGTPVPEDRQVDLVLSSGPATVEVPQLVRLPNLSGLALTDAQATLEELGLETGEIIHESSDEVAGRVARTIPGRFLEVAIGSKVGLVISTGPIRVRVPNVIGRTETQARDELEAFGLRVGNVGRDFSNDVDEELIVRTEPQIYRNVPAGSEIELIISQGPRPTRFPAIEIIHPTVEVSRP